MKNGILQRLLTTQRDNRSLPLPLLMGLGLGSTRSGVSVSPTSAMAATAVWACVRILAESVAQLPLRLYERTPEGKRLAPAHPLYTLLHDVPNPELTSFQLRRAMMVHIATYGNAYCEIEWQDNFPVALWPLSPEATKPVHVDGRLFYESVMPNGDRIRLPAYRVWHVAGLGFDPLVGVSPVRQHMEAIGLAQAMQAHGAAFFGNGARPGIVIKTDELLTKESAARANEAFSTAYEGLDNAYRTMILQKGWDVATVGFPPDQAEFLGSREFQTVEIARIYNVPPHMIQHLADATYSNIEHQGLQFVTNTLMPYLVGFEQSITRDLLVGEERQRYFAEFLVDGLQRSDITSRYSAYATAIQNGFMSINEARSRENFNPVQDGDTHLVPMNLQPLGTKPAQTGVQGQRSEVACGCGVEHRDAATDATDALQRGREGSARSFVPVMSDVFARTVRRESKAVSRAAGQYLRQRSVEDFDAWLERFYDELLPTLQRDMTPSMLAVAEQAALSVANELGGEALETDDVAREFINAFLNALGIDYIRSSKGQIRNAMQAAVDNGEDMVEAVDTQLAHMEDERPADRAEITAFEALNALIVMNYSRRGIRRIRWVANGRACPFCKRIDGKVAGIEEFFVGEGETIDLGDLGGMKIDRSKRHGPLHRGCQCSVRAEVEV